MKQEQIDAIIAQRDSLKPTPKGVDGLTYCTIKTSRGGYRAVLQAHGNRFLYPVERLTREDAEIDGKAAYRDALEAGRITF